MSLTIGIDRARGQLEKKSTIEDKRDGAVGDGTSTPSIPSFYMPSFLQRSNVKDQLKTEIEYAQELTVLCLQIKDLNISFSDSLC